MKKKRFFVFCSLLSILGISFYICSARSISSVLKSPSKIALVFSSRDYHPLIESEIQGKKILFYLDLGGCESLYLSKYIFDQLEKIDLKKNANTMDFKGNRYCSPIYSVPDIKIASQNLSVHEIVQESPAFEENTHLWPQSKQSTPKYQGRIGWPFFKNHVAFFCFPSSIIYLWDTLNELKKDKVLNFRNFESLPFTVENGVLVISIETDVGKSKVILDTGASYSIFRKSKVDIDKILPLSKESSYFKSSKLLIGNCNFGGWSFALAEFTNLIDVDGVMGIDFFLEHPVLFDFENRIVYFEKPRSVLGTQWKRAKFYIIQFFKNNNFRK